MKRRIDKGRLASELAGLSHLDRPALVKRWRQVCDCEPPFNISRSLLLQALAYRMQEKALGGLKPATKRLLKKITQEHATGRQVAIPAHTIRPGTRLLREWHGTTYEVSVTEDGVQFQGKRYRSLSEVAYSITGVKWSGPLFFGLKKGAT